MQKNSKSIYQKKQISSYANVQIAIKYPQSLNRFPTPPTEILIKFIWYGNQIFVVLEAPQVIWWATKLENY